MTKVCSACHSLKYVAFRNLEQIGYDRSGSARRSGKLAGAGHRSEHGGDHASGLPTDYFPSPYPNEGRCARGEQQRYPARSFADHQGASATAPTMLHRCWPAMPSPTEEDLQKHPGGLSRPRPGLYFNEYFYNINIAMAPPLTTTPVR